MPNDAHGLQHDIGLLEKAIAIAIKAVASGLLSAAECEAVRAEMTNLANDVAALNHRLDLVR